MDPKLSASLERILTVGVAYGLAKYSSSVQGLTPDIVVILLAGGTAGWAWYKNRKAAIITSAAHIPEVKKIELDKSQPETKSLNEATPDSVVISKE
jgi:predicted negative regulator of RcsB-dependent stress response